MSVRRRRFLGLTLGAAAGTALGSASGKVFSDLLSSADTPLFPPKGPESFVLSVCDMCPGGCGVRARRIGERIVKLEGNPFHPVNGGRLCPKGQASLQALYHPDRPEGPLRRRGPRGSIRSFEPASWDQALAEIGARLRALQEQRRPESLVLLRGASGGIGPRLAQRFLQGFGSPNDVALARGEEAASLALWLSQGVRATPAPDVQSTDYVLSLGSALLEASSSPVHMARAYGAFRQGRTGRRGKLVQVEPRLSITGASADEWIAVHPGSEATFALGLAAVLVSEDLYERQFVVEHTSGFEALRSLLEKHYGLERVAAETGVSVNVVLRIAREFAAARRSLAVGPRRGPLLPGSVFGHLAAQVLNALVGNVDAPGGLLVPEPAPLAAWPALPADGLAEAGRRRPRLDGAGRADFKLLASDPEGLAEAILAGAPYKAEVLFLLGADPAFTSAAPERFVAALDRVSCSVSFVTVPDDTALHADWILPEAHPLERWDMFATPAGVAYPVLGLARPTLPKPLGQARPVAGVFLDLARAVGLSAAFPWPDVETLLRAEFDGLYRARRGALMGSGFDEAWVRMMEGAGWWAPGYRSAEELWTKAQECGGWWDPFYDHGDWRRVLPTASGRFELRADLLVPRVASAATQGTLALHLFEPLAIAGGRGAELPFLQAILDPGHEERWETWVEIHPQSAKNLGIGDRDRVRVRSPHGALDARARVTTRVVPGVAAIPLGLGKRFGRWAAGRGANPLCLLQPGREALSGLPDFDATRVSVSRLAGPESLAARS
jgi:anaerobic selenocysteine-containing dehydrogenase